MALSESGIVLTVYDPVANRLKTTPILGGTPTQNTSVHDEEQAIWQRVYDPVTQTLRTIQVA